MKYIIEVTMDNAAFTERPEYELGRILEYIAECLVTGGIYEGSLRDVNGNTVGQARLESDPFDVEPSRDPEDACDDCGQPQIDEDGDEHSCPADVAMPEGPF